MRWKRIFILCITFIMSIGLYGCELGEEYQEIYEKAQEKSSKGDFDSAIDSYSMLIEAYPDRTEAYLGRGTAYIKSVENYENLNRAIKDYREALELDSNNVEIYVAIIDAYIRANAFDVAEEYLIEAQQKFKDERIEGWVKKFTPQENEFSVVTDIEGRIRKISCYDEYLDLVWYASCFYENERNSEIKVYGANGIQQGQVVCEYDERGNQLTGYEYDWTGIYEVNRTFNENNQELTVIWTDMNGQLYYKESYQYDGDYMTWCKYESFKKNVYTNTLEYQYEYDTDGEKVKTLGNICRYDSNGELELRLVSESSKNGSIHTTYNASGEIIEIEKFDANGNRVS